MMKNSLITRFSSLRSVMLKNTPNVVTRPMSNGSEDMMTHTGQKWDNDDYRMARFMHAPKQVNPSWAVNLIAQVPPKVVTERVVWCDGGSGPEGHPRVYINLDKPGDHSCGYCGLRFMKAEHH